MNVLSDFAPFILYKILIRLAEKLITFEIVIGVTLIMPKLIVFFYYHIKTIFLSPKMNHEQLKLWDKIKKFELDDPEISLSFTDRLARENGWTIEYATRTISEYKKFIFLLTLANHPLTPSDQVDQVWHLHLLYTQSYWEDFCKNTIKRNIHHGPTKGGDHEKEKFTNWYEKTKELYLDVFKSEVPKDIWPSNEIRFSEINFQRVNLKTNWIIKKPFK